MTTVDTAIALTTLADQKEFLKIGGAAEDSALSLLINEVSRIINTFTRRQLVKKSYTEFYDGDGSDELILKNVPIVAVTQVNDDIDRTFGSGDDLSISADILIDKEAGILRLWNNESVFLTGKANVKVAYSAGYDVAAIPQDLQWACQKLVAFQYHQRKDGRYGQASQSHGLINVNFTADEIPKDVLVVLNRYIDRGTPGRSFA